VLCYLTHKTAQLLVKKMLTRISAVPVTVTVLLLALSSNAAHASKAEVALEVGVWIGRVAARYIGIIKIPREIPRRIITTAHRGRRGARYSFEIPSGKLTMPKKIGTIGPVQLKGGEVNLYRIGRWGVLLGYCTYINCKNEVLDRFLGKKDRQRDLSVSDNKTGTGTSLSENHGPARASNLAVQPFLTQGAPLGPPEQQSSLTPFLSLPRHHLAENIPQGVQWDAKSPAPQAGGERRMTSASLTRRLARTRLEGA
jgi:hypothetical protein